MYLYINIILTKRFENKEGINPAISANVRERQLGPLLLLLAL